MNLIIGILLSIFCLFTGHVLADKYNCQTGHQGRHCDECGLQYETPNLKIVGGLAAVPHSWPQQAMVVFTFKGRVMINGVLPYMINQRYLCGGSLISRDTVLTAGHCIVKQIQIPFGNNVFVANVTPNEYYPTMESMYTVYLGIQNYTSAIYTAQNIPDGGQKMAVSKVLPHPNYEGEMSDSSTNFNDIAIIKLSQEAQLTSTVQLACLPDPTKKNYPTDTNQDIYTMGYGTLSADGPLPNKLYNVKLTLYDGSKCDQVIPDVPKDWSIQICAGELSGGKDTCQGDSGGAIFVKDILANKVKYIAVGITSYGDSCALPNEPGIYTKISPYMNWINDNM